MTTASGAGRWRNLLLHWGPTLLFSVLLPIITFDQLQDRMGEVAALLLSGLWPALQTVIELVVARKVDEFAVFSLIFIGISALTAVGFNSPRLLLVKDSAVTGLAGLVLLGSLLAPRPLMFYFGRKFATNGTAESIAWWNGLWQYPGFRRSQYLMTSVWGVTLVAEAALRIWLSYLLPTETMVTVNAILPLVVLGCLIAWTISYGARQRQRGEARGAGASVPDAAA